MTFLTGFLVGFVLESEVLYHALRSAFVVPFLLRCSTIHPMSAPQSNSNSSGEEFLQVNYAHWFWRVAGWDVVLPIIIFVAPLIAEMWIEKHEKNCGLYVVFVAIPAFLIRGWRGLAAIRTNNCGAVRRFFQGVCLISVAVIMLLADALALSLHDIGPGVSGTLVIGLLALTISLPLMIFAMYPGLELRSSDYSATICGRCGGPVRTQGVFLCEACARERVY